MEAIEAPTAGDELRPLLLEHLPHRPVGAFGMRMGRGVGDALVQQPGVQLVVALHPQPWREEALAHQANLILDLALLPSGGRRASHRFQQMMRAHLQEAAVVLPVLADKDGVHRCLHVMGWTPPASRRRCNRQPRRGAWYWSYWRSISASARFICMASTVMG